MKRRIILLAILALLDSKLYGAAPSKPNVVILYADDLGYGDVSGYNPDRGKIATPNIDRLAAQGVRFTDAHSSSGVCSPSRYTLLTGRYHWRTRLQQGIVKLWEPPLIAPDRLTIGKLAQQHDYRTACIGKWHLGWEWRIASEAREHFDAPARRPEAAEATDEARAAWRTTFQKPIGGGPTIRGFDEYFGTDVPNWPPFCFIENDRTVGVPTELLPARPYRNCLPAQHDIDRLCNLVGTDQFLWGTPPPVQIYNAGKPEYRYEYVLDVTDGDVIAILSGWLWQYILKGEESHAVPTNVYRRFRNKVGRPDPKKCKAWLAVKLPSDPFTQLVRPKESLAALEPFDHILIAWPFTEGTSILTVRENRAYWQG